jgi:lipopolysaccharide/colanic/teichoic acid biosynthesis glycosyltransferase
LGDIIVRDSIGTIVILDEEQTKNYVTASLYRNLAAGIEIISFVDFYEMIFSKVPLGELREEWFLENIARRHRGYNTLKRAIDIIASLCVGLVFIVLSPLVYCATKWSSPGPFIFSQTRVGKNGKPFTLYKVRTMRHDPHHRWPTENDNRITSVGKILRATHIDELPQALNILRGDISLIGPRPDFIDFFKKLEEQIPYYAIRTLVKPGVTGWAQTNYPITASLEETRVRLSYDLYYLKHYSLALDTLIILKTLKTMITAAGR